MTLEEIFWLSQTIAAVAIVGSLLFVAMEVRSSNQVSRHWIVEELLADYRDMRMGMASNADVASVAFGTPRFRSARSAR